MRRYSDDGRRWIEDAVVRNSAHGLVQVGRPAVAGLIDVLENGTPRGRKHAAFALGEIGAPAARDGLIRRSTTPTCTCASPAPRR